MKLLVVDQYIMFYLNFPQPSLSRSEREGDPAQRKSGE